MIIRDFIFKYFHSEYLLNTFFVPEKETMGNSFRNMKSSNEDNFHPEPSQKRHVSEANQKEMGDSHDPHEPQMAKDTAIKNLWVVSIVGLFDLSLVVSENKQQAFAAKGFKLLKWCKAHYGKVAIGIASIALFYYVIKGKKPNRLEEALRMFEMKDMSEYSKKSLNWIYLCKKKQFTSSKGLGNAFAAAFYEEKLRRLEEARQIIQEEAKKQEILKEEKDKDRQMINN